MLAALLIPVVMLFSLSACSVKLVDLNYTPRAREPYVAPVEPGTSAVETLLKRSQKESDNGTKIFLINGTFSEAFITQTGLTPDNCAQGVELQNGDIVVDFGNVPCPEGQALLPKESIVFSLYYDERTESTSALALGTTTLGLIALDPTANLAVLDSLCSGAFGETCTLGLTNGRFAGLVVK